MRTKCETDRELTDACCDGIRHHTEHADGRECERKHGKHRDEPSIEVQLPHRIGDHVVHRLHVEDRKTRIDFSHSSTNLTDLRLRRTLSTDNERHSDITRRRDILCRRVEDLRLRRTVQAGLTNVANNADDGAAIESHSDRIVVRKIAPHQRFVDHDHLRRCLVVVVRESAAGDHAYTYRREISRRDITQSGDRAAGHRTAEHAKVGVPAPVLKRHELRQAGTADAVQCCHPLLDAVVILGLCARSQMKRQHIVGDNP